MYMKGHKANDCTYCTGTNPAFDWEILQSRVMEWNIFFQLENDVKYECKAIMQSIYVWITGLNRSSDDRPAALRAKLEHVAASCGSFANPQLRKPPQCEEKPVVENPRIPIDKSLQGWDQAEIGSKRRRTEAWPQSWKLSLWRNRRVNPFLDSPGSSQEKY